MIYINDLWKSSKLNILSFADDTTIYVSGPNLYELVPLVNKELHQIYEWLCVNRLCLNVNKSKFMIFSAKNIATDFTAQPLKINDTILTQCGEKCETKFVKFLGITMDDSLTWTHHIDHIGVKISRSLNAISTVKYILPSSALKSLYYAMIQPHLSYGILAWGQSSKVEKLFKLQKRAVRVICRKPYAHHSEPLFKSEEILKLRDHHTLSVLLFMHDYTYNRLPRSFNHLYKRVEDVRKRSTRQTNRYITSCPRTKFTENLSYHLFPRVWNNNITEQNANIDSKPRFKNIYKQLFLDRYANVIT